MSRFSSLADWLSWQETLHPRSIDLGLERLRRTLDRLGWKRPACPVITVGGTNGKGSCVALLSRILGCAGYRVGTFTSPHLRRYNERITIAGSEISDASLVAAFERIDAARGEDTLTFFEFNTLAALLVFETAGLDAIVLEVGMGGRLDAVNVVDPDVAVVSSISLDHCDWLGADVEKIGAEKAGIFRPQRPAIFGSLDMPRSLADHAAAIGADLLRLGVDFDFQREDTVWSWRSLRRGVGIERLPPPALIVNAQYDNASAVLQALYCLRERLPVPRAAIEAGLRTVGLPGRFQVIRGAVDWILDVAHNPAAARTLAEQLRQDPQRRTWAVCGILGDKDVEGIVRELADCFVGWIIAGLDGARALAPQQLAERLSSAGATVVGTAATVQAACESASALAAHGERIVVFGSFLTVGPALQWLEEQASANG